MKRLVVFGPRSVAALARRAASPGYDVAEATNIEEALDLLAPAIARVLLVVDGWGGETWERSVDPVRNSNPGVAVIVVLPSFDARLWMEIVKHGAIDVLSEPLDTDHALAVIRAACQAADTKMLAGQGTLNSRGVRGWLARSWRVIRHWIQLPLNHSFTDLKG